MQGDLPAPPLPHPPTSLVGREQDVAAIVAAVTRNGVRLLTLTGVGGVGKSRVALAVAHAIRPHFDGAVFLGDFAAVGGPALLAPTLSALLGLPAPAEASSLHRLERAIGQRRVAIVLDNFDRVIPHALPLADLLAACPGLIILATSRSRLRLRGETVRPIPPLPTSASDAATPEALREVPAVQLFVARGQEVDHGFALTADNATPVGEIVRRLDGIPLAIELAAARLDLLPPAALLARLQQRLLLLTGGARDLPDRLQTMRQAIAWSYDLLTPDEQRMVERLAVFADGIPLAGAVAVCGDGDEVSTLDLLGRLGERSLLVRESTAETEPRFRMLQTIREFALDRLAGSGLRDETMGRLAAWCLNLAETAAEIRVKTSGAPELIARIEAEHATLREVMSWLESRAQPDDFLRLTAALGWFWLHRSHRAEGRRWLDSAIAQATAAGIRSVVLARALDGAAVLAFSQGDYARASLLVAAYAALSQALGDRWGVAAALNLHGAIARAQGDLDAADIAFAEALARFQEIGDSGWIALATLNRGAVAYWQGQAEQATALMREALARYQAADDAYGQAIALSDLGRALADANDHVGAAARFRESLGHWRRVGTKEGLIDWLTRTATLAAQGGAAERAMRWFSAAETVRTTIGYMFDHPERARQRQALETARLALGEERATAAWAGGRALKFDDAVVEADAWLLAGAASPAPAATARSNVLAGLTPRERDVLRLVVQGQSDRQIGDALYISHRTVMRHVENVLAKFDVKSRTAAATFAVRHGFV